MPMSMRKNNSKCVLANPHARRIYNRRYYRVWPTGHTDESLFGKTTHREVNPGKQDDCYTYRTHDTQALAKWNHDKQWDRTGKHTVRCIAPYRSSDIRFLNVPRLDPSERTIMLGRSDLDRLKMAAVVITPEQRFAENEERKLRLEEQSEEVKERLQAIMLKDRSRHENEKLTDLEEEERVKRQQYVEKAKAYLTENEAEMRALNSLILDAKVRTLRDVQCAQNKQIADEIKTEDLRLNAIMEEARINGNHIEEKLDQKRNAERLLCAKAVIKQMEINEVNKLADLDTKDRENDAMMAAIGELCESEKIQTAKIKAAKVKYHKELDDTLEEHNRRKNIEAANEQVLRKTVSDEQDAKAARDAKHQAEVLRNRREKALEIDRMRQLQQKLRDRLADRNELLAKRDQDEIERKWRKKEQLRVYKEEETKRLIVKWRAKQAEHKQHFLSQYVQRNRVGFARVLKSQLESLEKETRELDQAKKRKERYCHDLLSQMKDNERMKIAECNQWYKDGIDMDDEQRKRIMRLEDTKTQKLLELRALGIPEMYCRRVDAKGQMNMLPPLLENCKASDQRAPKIEKLDE